MKNIILLILFFTISIFTSCATCEERPDTHSYLNEFDKSILHFKSDAELKYLKNNSEEITFKIPKTVKNSIILEKEMMKYAMLIYVKQKLIK